MSSDLPPQPPTQPWYTSSQIRIALMTIAVPLFVRIAQHTFIGQWLVKYLGIDILTMKAEDIVDWLMAAIAALGGVVWIKKRVAAGKDPRSCAPEIVPPMIVQRLTGNVRVPPAETEQERIRRMIRENDELTKKFLGRAGHD